MKYIVTWRYNNHNYFERFDTLLQAQLRLWKLNDAYASIHVVE